MSATPAGQTPAPADAAAAPASAAPTVEIDPEIYTLTDAQVEHRISMLRNNVRVMRQEEARLRRTAAQLDAKIRDNQEKLKLNKTLPYLVANVVEVLDVEAEDGADTTAGGGQSGSKAAVVRTSNRQVRGATSGVVHDALAVGLWPCVPLAR